MIKDTHRPMLGLVGSLFFGCVLQTGAEERPFLWQVGDGPSPSYLMGSIHVAKKEMYPLPAAVEEAFSRCETLVVEADPEGLGMAGMQKLIAEYAYYPDGQTLSDHLDEPSMKALGDILDRFGMSPERFARLKPWYVSQVITLLELSRLGIDPQNGVDLHFLRQARGQKAIIELEGILFQLMFLNDFTAEEQRLMLVYTLRDLARMEGVFEDIFDAWESGDPERLNLLFTDFLKESEGLEDVYEKLLAGRNTPMFRKIMKLLEEGKASFIVVGAGHLIGERGLLQMLENAGVPVTQVSAEPAPAGVE